GFVERMNDDLASYLGNLLNRSVAMISKYVNGEIRAFVASGNEYDQQVDQLMKETVIEVEEAMEGMHFSGALASIWKLISRTNKYIDETEPWVLAKDENKQERIGNIMAHLVEALRISAVML